MMHKNVERGSTRRLHGDYIKLLFSSELKAVWKKFEQPLLPSPCSCVSRLTVFIHAPSYLDLCHRMHCSQAFAAGINMQQCIYLGNLSRCGVIVRRGASPNPATKTNWGISLTEGQGPSEGPNSTKISLFLSPKALSFSRNCLKMSEGEASLDEGEPFRRVRQKIADKSKKVVQTKEILSKQAVQTKEILSKQAVKIAKQAEEHERFINKVTHLLGVLGFGAFCYFLGARPQDVPYVYCLFYISFVPLRWIYYRYKKWHYYLLDFCYYANTIFLVMVLFYPKNEKLFMVCFSFAEGPLAWALIVWRCSLVFSSVDKIVSVLIHLIPGIVFFTIRWWDPETFAAMHPVGKAARISWPYVEDKSYLWTWLFLVPLVAYTLWQLLYFLIVNVLRHQRLLRDPEVMTSYRELSKKAQKANNIWWRLSGLLGDQNRPIMYILFQAAFTVATLALTVPIFLSYELHVIFQILKVSATIWNGGSFLLEVMPRQVVQKEKRKLEMKPIPIHQDQTKMEPSTNGDHQLKETTVEN